MSTEMSMTAPLRAASARAQGELMGQLSAFERVGRGAVLVDRNGRIIHCNACVRFEDGLEVEEGILQTARVADRERLHAFLDAVIDGFGTPGTLMTLTLPRPSGGRPWLIDGVGCHHEEPSDRASLPSRAALLLITDVERPPLLSAERLSELFALTSTEARLARELVSGRSLQEISVRLGISEGHARQRLKVIFEKTATSRQGELIALLAKLN
jgi:DNA-binding CsgD family transcriptional regulator